MNNARAEAPTRKFLTTAAAKVPFTNHKVFNLKKSEQQHSDQRSASQLFIFPSPARLPAPNNKRNGVGEILIKKES
jgi:hypothetical protein